MVKIIIDTQGSDRGAATIIRGAGAALRKFSDLSAELVGDIEEMKKTAEEIDLPADRVEFLHAPTSITNFDDPAEAIFKKTDSSMLRGLGELSRRDDVSGMLSAGNTGVLLAGTVRYLLCADRTRPAMAALLPAADGSFTCLVDAGATIDCTPQMLCHFAHLGTDTMRRMYSIESPRVGLLSNGAEPTKGNKLVKETHVKLAEDPDINFIGNVEGNTALSGVCDVLVCDGFAGNQVLKVTEGTAARIMRDIIKYAHTHNGGEAISALAAELMGRYDIASLGGGIILGAAKPVIKLRGSSGEDAVVNTAEMIINLSRGRTVYDKE